MNFIKRWLVKRHVRKLDKILIKLWDERKDEILRKFNNKNERK